ncbi:MAG: DUF637 domain-containing protein, partial [Halobacteriovoraceae bacterium]|nr:DUF637 domain-containing protein [Halobacteriovoraceae bacterium]
PNGITCNGCGFINTPRATLTTGSPELADGELTNLNVDKGVVTIGSLGLDATETDSFEIISRAAQINGAIQAKEAKILAGRNNYHYKTKQHQVKADDGSTRPSFGIDSSALGGMYAGKITLIGTESGVGVAAPANLASSSGPIEINSAGKLIVTNAISESDLSLSATDIEITKQAYSKTKTTINTQDLKIKQDALLASKNKTTVNTQGLELEENALLASGISATGSLEAQGELEINADLIDSKKGTLASGKELNINANSLDLSQDAPGSSVIKSLGNIKLNVDSLNNTNNTIEAVGGVNIDGIQELTGDILAGSIQIDSDQFTNEANLEAGSILIQTSGDLTNNKNIIAGSDLQITSANVVNNYVLSSSGSLSVLASSIVNNDLIASAGDLLLAATGRVDNEGGAIFSGQNLGIYSDIGIKNYWGDILAQGDINLAGFNNDSTGHLANYSGVIESFGGDINIAASNVINQNISLDTATMSSVRDLPLAPNYTVKHKYRKLIIIYIDLKGGLWCDPNNDLFGTCREHISYREDFLDAPLSSIEMQEQDYDLYYGPVNVVFYPHEKAKTETTLTEYVSTNLGPAQILAGNDINIAANTITNDMGLIAANNNVNLTGNTLTNKAKSLRTTKTIDTTFQNYRYWCESNGVWKHCYEERWDTYTSSSTHTDRNIYGTIQAGNTLTGDFTGQINNTTIKQGAGDHAGGFADAPSVTPANSASVNLASIINRGSLFILAPSMSGYLYETRASFIDMSRFLSSDYFLNRISAPKYDLDKLQRKFGDAYIETRLIREQAFEMTGRRLLSGYGSDLEQMKALYDNAYASMEDLGLIPGIELTSEQIAALRQDIVWLESQEINGELVLVPRLYLSSLTQENLDAEGAQIIAKNINLGGANVLSNGLIESEGSLQIGAQETIANLGGTISGQNVELNAANIISNTQMIKDEYKNGYEIQEGKKAKIKASQNLSLNASEAITSNGGSFEAGDNLSLSAGKGITLSATQSERKRDDEIAKTRTYRDIYGNTHEVKEVFGHESEHEITNNLVQLHAGGNLNLNSGADINLVGVNASAGQAANIEALGDVGIESVQDYYNYDFLFEHSTSGIMGSDYSASKKITQTSTQRTTLTSSSVLRVESKAKDISIKAASLEADSVELKAQKGEITLSSQKDTDFYQETEESSSALWLTNKNKGHQKEDAELVEIQSKDLELDTTKVNIDVLAEGDINQAINELSKDPKLAYLSKLKNDPRINWSAVQEVYDEWDYSSQNLSAAASVIIAIAVSIATSGAGAAIAGAVSNAAMGAALSAGFSAIVTQASLSMINNGGNLGEVLSELGSEESVRGLATSMATAGVTGGVSPSSVGANFGERLVRAGFDATVSAGSETIFNKASFTDSLEDHLKTAGINLAGEYAANEIGSTYGKASADGINPLEYLAHKAAHGVLGCAMGAASEGSCSGGAIGGVVGEIVAEEIYKSSFDEEISLDFNSFESKRMEIANIAKLAGGVAALTSGEDVQSGVLSAENAAKNNSAVAAAIMIGLIAADYGEDVAMLIKGKLTGDDQLAEESWSNIKDSFQGNVDSAIEWEQAAMSSGMGSIPPLVAGSVLGGALKASAVRVSMKAGQIFLKIPGASFVLGKAKTIGSGIISKGKSFLSRNGSEVAQKVVNDGIIRTPYESGVVREFMTEQDEIYYRVFSEGGNQTGSYVTKKRPLSSDWAQEALSLPEFNDASLIQEVLIPRGTKLRRSRAAGLKAHSIFPKRRGGGEQFKIINNFENVPKFKFGEGQKLD